MRNILDCAQRFSILSYLYRCELHLQGFTGDHRKIMNTSEAFPLCIISACSRRSSTACCGKNIPPGGGSEPVHFKRCHVYWGKVLAGGTYPTPRRQPMTKSMFCEVSRRLHASFSRALKRRDVLRLTSLSPFMGEKTGEHRRR